MNDDVRVMIVDDHEIVRTGIAEIVERSQGLTVVAESQCGAGGSAVARRYWYRPDSTDEGGVAFGALCSVDFF